MNKRNLLCAVVVLAVALCFAGSPAAAEEGKKFEIRQGDTVKSLLDDRVGQPVTLILSSGQEITGKVAAVGDALVHLTQLSGREFFDAAVGLDSVAGVVVRVRSR